MSLSYGASDISNLVYNNSMSLKADIKVNKKKNERKFNNDLRLLLSELLFITRYVKYDMKYPKIIYIGAAPGFHLVKLMKMCPQIFFDLYDDQPFHEELEQYAHEYPDQVTLFREKFDIKTCDKYDASGYDLYLITDHRDPKFMEDPIFPRDAKHNEIKKKFQEDKEKSYFDDMEFQKQICKRLNLIYAYLRFRPPHFYTGVTTEPATFNYFYGTIWLMIFNDYKSTESRIAVDDFTSDNFAWNYKDYQYRLNYFNDEVRESLLLNPITKDQTPLPNQLGNKFETVMMFQIIKEYFAAIDLESPTVDDLINFYVDFLVVETCSDVPGIFTGCDFLNKNEDQGCYNPDDFEN